MYEQVAGVVREVDVYRPGAAGTAGDPGARPMNVDELRAGLTRTEALLRQPPPNAGPEERVR